MKVFKFYAEWCGPCKVQSQIIKSAGDKVTTEIVDVNIDENIALATDFQVRGVPTMVMVDENEKEVKRKVGVMKEQELLEWLKG